MYKNEKTESIESHISTTSITWDTHLWGGPRSLCERTQRPEQGRGFDEAVSQPPLQWVQWCGQVLILKHGGEQLAEDLQVEPPYINTDNAHRLTSQLCQGKCREGTQQKGASLTFWASSLTLVQLGFSATHTKYSCRASSFRPALLSAVAFRQWA